ncbi:hypothetical protein HR45_01855 [Shewanella mangrovi]|uniref:Lipoprotein n=1 Tax=Shewanella mangrovi TaxID=1515746 RepID=A0A094K382_9GAMM|nr:hypothetical protein [Shewanella mangrovi]KFZ39166.1 hypothetical protein HR45_01855 [Shewanella mangrovi]
MKYMLVVLAIMLSGCSSVSETTGNDEHLVTFDEQDFVGINPDSIRARLVVDDFVKLRTIKLGAEIVSAEGSIRKEFPLVLVGIDMMQAERSWIFITQSRNRYQFQLTAEGKREFAEFQKWLNGKSCTHYSYAFDVKFEDNIDRPFRYTLKLMLQPSQGYITMVDNRQVQSPFLAPSDS